jgi:hypothetical protein
MRQCGTFSRPECRLSNRTKQGTDGCLPATSDGDIIKINKGNLQPLREEPSKRGLA